MNINYIIGYDWYCWRVPSPPLHPQQLDGFLQPLLFFRLLRRLWFKSFDIIAQVSDIALVFQSAWENMAISTWFKKLKVVYQSHRVEAFHRTLTLIRPFQKEMKIRRIPISFIIKLNDDRRWLNQSPTRVKKESRWPILQSDSLKSYFMY